MFNNAMNESPIDQPTPDAGRAPHRDETGEWVHAHPSKIARIRRRLLDQHAGSALAETFKVLGDLTRVRILDALARSELCVCDLADLVGLSESAVSHQLRLLRSMRVVRARRAGRLVFYALDDEHVIALFEQGLRHIEEATPRRPAGRRPAGAGDLKCRARDAARRRPAPCARCTPNRSSGSRGWTATKKWPSSSGGSSRSPVWKTCRPT